MATSRQCTVLIPISSRVFGPLVGGHKKFCQLEFHGVFHNKSCAAIWSDDPSKFFSCCLKKMRFLRTAQQLAKYSSFSMLKWIRPHARIISSEAEDMCIKVFWYWQVFINIFTKVNRRHWLKFNTKSHYKHFPLWSYFSVTHFLQMLQVFPLYINLICESHQLPLHLVDFMHPIY